MPNNDKTSGGFSVGIVVLCRNNEKTVGNTIQSVMNQTYKNITLLIVNDCSVDKSQQVIKEYFTQLKGEHLEENESILAGSINHIPTILINNFKQEGGPVSKNKGIMALWKNAKYFMVLYGDSELSNDAIEKYVSVIDSDQNIGIVYSNSVIYDIENDVEYDLFATPYNRMLLERNSDVSSIFMVSKAALEGSGIYEHTLDNYEDWDLWLRITERLLAVHIAETLNKYVLIDNINDEKSLKRVQERALVRRG